ncbi:MAG: L-2-amino-thiazoline-4-carboxylic acid hydrolase [Candidatus Vecturithrix sp.]|nr:L-2-amino-thiazoline-4-carboxylic acid hydrolase [Candidatus Vecturithrix sp.]
MPIVNIPQNHGQHIDDLRAAIEHRATWMYLLLDEARQRGLNWEDFARKAIRRCGCFHGESRFSKTDRADVFANEFATENVKQIFDLDICELTEERFVCEFHYCPLVSAWQKIGAAAEDIPQLCDLAMEGDRGILATIPDLDFCLEQTLARGERVCRIVISKAAKDKTD